MFCPRTGHAVPTTNKTLRKKPKVDATDLAGHSGVERTRTDIDFGLLSMTFALYRSCFSINVNSVPTVRGTVARFVPKITCGNAKSADKLGVGEHILNLRNRLGRVNHEP